MMSQAEFTCSPLNVLNINAQISTLPPFRVSGKYVDAILKIASLHQENGETLMKLLPI